MATLDIFIQQMGEGLRKVIVARLLKQAGDYVERDEIICEMETDGATLQVESPYEGRLHEWLVQEGDILSIGAPMARIETGSPAMAVMAPDWSLSEPKELPADPTQAQSPFLSPAEFQRQLDATANQVNSIRSTVLSSGPGDRERLLESHLREKVAELLGRSRSEIDSRKPLRTLGVDSRMTVELQKHLEGSLGIPLPSTLIWNYPTIVALAAQLARVVESQTREREGSRQAKFGVPPLGGQETS